MIWYAALVRGLSVFRILYAGLVSCSCLHCYLHLNWLVFRFSRKTCSGIEQVYWLVFYLFSGYNDLRRWVWKEISLSFSRAGKWCEGGRDFLVLRVKPTCNLENEILYNKGTPTLVACARLKHIGCVQKYLDYLVLNAVSWIYLYLNVNTCTIKPRMSDEALWNLEIKIKTSVRKLNSDCRTV